MRNDHVTSFGKICLLIVSPVMSSIVNIVSVLIYRRASNASYFLSAMSIVILLSLINFFKVPYSDLADYYALYESAKMYSLSEFLLLAGKEPFFYWVFYVFASSKIVSGEAFIFLTSLVGYAVLGFALSLWARDFGLRRHYYWLVFILFLLFPPLFLQSAHLVRQFIAGSLLVLALTIARNCIGVGVALTLAATLVHSSAIVFLPFVILYNYSRLHPISTLVFVTILPLIFLVFVRQFGSIFPDVPFLGYIFQRLSQDSFQELEQLGVVATLFVLFLLGSSGYLLSSMFFSQRAKAVSDLFFPMVVFTISLYLLLGAWAGEALLVTRYLLYLYFLSPFIMLGLCLRLVASDYILRFTIVVAASAFPFFIINNVWVYDFDRVIYNLGLYQLIYCCSGF